MKWKEFRIGDLFTQSRGKESAPNKVEDGNIPMVNEISSNNGIAKYASSKNILKGNAITVSVNYASNVFYQKNDFCASVNILVLYADFLTENIGLFIATLLRKNNQKYNYAQKISKDRLNDTIIKLPIKTSVSIDYTMLEAIGGGSLI